jgi:MFS family permease
VGSCAGAQIGGHRLLLGVVFLWSLSTILTPLIASSYRLLLISRIVLGIGEGLGLIVVILTYLSVYFEVYQQSIIYLLNRYQLNNDREHFHIYRQPVQLVKQLLLWLV